MQASEIQALLNEYFGDKAGFDPAKAQEMATALANASSVVAQQAGIRAIAAPTPQQQACYAKCQTTRDAALASAALLGFPGGLVAAAAAITAFNACRSACDQ